MEEGDWIASLLASDVSDSGSGALPEDVPDVPRVAPLGPLPDDDDLFRETFLEDIPPLSSPLPLQEPTDEATPPSHTLPTSQSNCSPAVETAMRLLSRPTAVHMRMNKRPREHKIGYDKEADSPEEKREQRKRQEQRRRMELTDQINELGQLVPTVGDPQRGVRVKKATVVEAASEYIRQLQEACRELLEYSATLAKENVQLRETILVDPSLYGNEDNGVSRDPSPEDSMNQERRGRPHYVLVIALLCALWIFRGAMPLGEQRGVAGARFLAFVPRGQHEERLQEVLSAVTQVVLTVSCLLGLLLYTSLPGNVCSTDGALDKARSLRRAGSSAVLEGRLAEATVYFTKSLAILGDRGLETSRVVLFFTVIRECMVQILNRILPGFIHLQRYLWKRYPWVEDLLLETSMNHAGLSVVLMQGKWDGMAHLGVLYARLRSLNVSELMHRNSVLIAVHFVKLGDMSPNWILKKIYSFLAKRCVARCRAEGTVKIHRVLRHEKIMDLLGECQWDAAANLMSVDIKEIRTFLASRDASYPGRDEHEHECNVVNSSPGLPITGLRAWMECAMFSSILIDSLGHPRDGRLLYEIFIRLATADNNPSGCFFGHLGAGLCSIRMGRLDEAHTSFQLCKGVVDQSSQADSFILEACTAEVLYRLGYKDEAFKCAQTFTDMLGHIHVWPVFLVIGLRAGFWTALSLLGLGGTGVWDDTRAPLLQEYLKKLVKAMWTFARGKPVGQAIFAYSMGGLRCLEGHQTRGLAAIRRAVELARTYNCRMDEGIALCYLAYFLPIHSEERQAAISSALSIFEGDHDGLFCPLWYAEVCTLANSRDSGEIA